MSKIKIIAYFDVHIQNLVKVGRSAAELLRIFDFQNGGRPPSWIWYDVIADHCRLVFDGPNILLKLHVDRFLLIARYGDFHIRPVWLEVAYSRPLGGGVFGTITPNEFRYCRSPQKDRPWAKIRPMSHKPWESIHGFDLGACQLSSVVICAEEIMFFLCQQVKANSCRRNLSEEWNLWLLEQTIDLGGDLDYVADARIFKGFLAPCGLRDCKNRPAPFPGRMS